MIFLRSYFYGRAVRPPSRPGVAKTVEISTLRFNNQKVVFLYFFCTWLCLLCPATRLSGCNFPYTCQLSRAPSGLSPKCVAIFGASWLCDSPSPCRRATLALLTPFSPPNRVVILGFGPLCPLYGRQIKKIRRRTPRCPAHRSPPSPPLPPRFRLSSHVLPRFSPTRFDETRSTFAPSPEFPALLQSRVAAEMPVCPYVWVSYCKMQMQTICIYIVNRTLEPHGLPPKFFPLRNSKIITWLFALVAPPKCGYPRGLVAFFNKNLTHMAYNPSEGVNFKSFQVFLNNSIPGFEHENQIFVANCGVFVACAVQQEGRRLTIAIFRGIFD